MLQLSESIAQTSRIQRIDGKRSGATLRTAWAADQPFARAASNIKERRVDDLY